MLVRHIPGLIKSANSVYMLHDHMIQDDIDFPKT